MESKPCWACVHPGLRLSQRDPALRELSEVGFRLGSHIQCMGVQAKMGHS